MPAILLDEDVDYPEVAKVKALAPVPNSRSPYARAKLQTASDAAKEIAKLYRLARSRQMPVEEASKLTNMLAVFSRIIMDSDIEKRVKDLERR